MADVMPRRRPPWARLPRMPPLAPRSGASMESRPACGAALPRAASEAARSSHFGPKPGRHGNSEGLRLHVFYELQEHGSPIKSLQRLPETYRNHLTQGALSSLGSDGASKPKDGPPGLRDWTTKVNPPPASLLLWPDRLGTASQPARPN